MSVSINQCVSQIGDGTPGRSRDFSEYFGCPFPYGKSRYKQKHEGDKNVFRTLFWILLYFFNEGLSCITKSRN